MTKITTLSDLTSLTNQTSAVNAINANNTRIEDAFANTLSRDGSSPNTMGADLDMNSNFVINNPDPTEDTHFVTKGYGDDNYGAAAAAAAAASAASAAASVAGIAADAASAAASAAAAALEVANMSGTSTTSLLIATGTKVFTTQSGKAFNGQNVRAYSAADSTNYMDGIATYTGTSCSVNVTTIGGSGTFADWVIKVNGAKGATGATGAAGSPGAGSGDVVSSGVVVDLHIAVFDGTSGDIIKDGGRVVGTMASQNSNGVSITGGTVTGITDVAIADGGTGSSTAAGAFTNLKQAASTTATGVVELATDAETITGTDTSRAITPANLAAKLATLSTSGVVRQIKFASSASNVSGTGSVDDLTSATLTSVQSGSYVLAFATANYTCGTTGLYSSTIDITDNSNNTLLVEGVQIGLSGNAGPDRTSGSAFANWTSPGTGSVTVKLRHTASTSVAAINYALILVEYAP